ncbi:carboxypeptidase-like regulatory domain-containing protein [Kordia sp. YSTF-M3]|uniref:Carboxypeptidase-like regulatory domain-containing protein n=1 Tax=Kordia aestuariivivens TaxID=2759037 RepID=A0ABR7Q437_9FLAO|nr:carboxypeptidase-like regulatory domain-containing protein [Kordia aestuariivivens]MBC8753312.1 carboxypeptidase-like regulatory domain-containing protein [Kordia aestuariivivens]
MKHFIITLLLLISFSQAICQVTGEVIDTKTKNPIAYANIWIQDTKSGTTTNEDGTFIFEKAKIGDTLKVSCVGYEEEYFIAKADNKISLNAMVVELDTVVLQPVTYKRIKKITTFKKKDLKKYYANGHYSIARYFPYKRNYKENPYIKEIKTLVWNSKREKVNFKMYLLKADNEGNPTNILIGEPQLFYVKRGVREVNWRLKSPILFPKEGVFVVIDRINIKDNLYSNEYQKNIIQPSISQETIVYPQNTWLRFSGDWKRSKEFKNIGTTGEDNIAINIELTD